jgi:hypothetical protein
VAGSLTTTSAFVAPFSYLGTVSSFDSTFTIAAADGGIVVGRQILDMSDPGANSCASVDRRNFGGDAVSLTYDALIIDGGSSYRDSGSAAATMSGQFGLHGEAFSFYDETFLTSQGLTPADQSTCAGGAWQLFGVFKNQGDCVSFLATHGHNVPAAAPSS